MPASTCLICNASTHALGAKSGQRTGRHFSLRRCDRCGFAFVENPWTDYASIYDEAYYSGKGSDPLVDYAFEFDHPGASIRHYEWGGIAKLVGSHQPVPAKVLDFGCGNGGLVRFLLQRGYDTYGFDTGVWAEKARASGLPVLSDRELGQHEGSFDVITMIEVIEHLVDPMSELRRLRRLLKPGGLLLILTGNAERAPRDFLSWAYVRPEIHVSYFTPQALTIALTAADFAAVPLQHASGWKEVIRFKMLKTLGVRRRNLLERVIPWSVLTRLVDWKYAVTAHPAGKVRGTPGSIRSDLTAVVQSADRAGPGLGVTNVHSMTPESPAPPPFTTSRRSDAPPLASPPLTA
jgi:SAM-dependent methyltransferase